jgi:hypothetical protein
MPSKLQEKKTVQLATHRSKLIAFARMLDLVDAETARAQVSEARENPDLAEETQREALRRLADAEILKPADLAVLSEFVARLDDDLRWLLHSESVSQNSGERVQDPEWVEDPSAQTFSEPENEQQPDSRPDASLEPAASGPDSALEYDRSHSTRGRSRHRKRQHDPLYDWDRPTLGTRFDLFMRNIPGTLFGVTKYWAEATQDWVQAHVRATGLIVAFVVFVIVTLATWFHFEKPPAPVAVAGPASLGEAAEEAEMPNEDRLVEIKDSVKQSDFDSALELLDKLRKSDQADNQDSSDLAWLESGLLLGQGGHLEWEQGGRTAWNEAGRLLLVQPDIESDIWRLQFATWLLYGADELRDQAMETVVLNDPSKSSVNYRLQAWMETRNRHADKALRILSDHDRENCELGDLLYRAIAYSDTGNNEAASADFGEFCSRLDAKPPANIHEELCHPQLQELRDRFGEKLNDEAQ